jgi:hypothetical protein
MYEDIAKIIVISCLSIIIVVIFYAAVKFFKIWRKFREESMFHLGILSLGLIIYFVLLGLVALWVDDIEAISFVLKRVLGILYGVLGLELSLFYLSAFVNRRNLLEKYIPFLFGMMIGLSIALVYISETSIWFSLILILIYTFPLVLIPVPVVRICIRTYEMLNDDNITKKDKNFVKALIVPTLVMTVGALIDIIFFWIVVVIELDIWGFLLPLSSIGMPLFLIVFLFIIKKIFKEIEEADVVHLMNLMS